MSRVAVVTGGGSGMGRAICRRLADAGRRVAVLDIDEEAAAAVADEVTASGGTACAVPVDVSDRAAVEAALDRVRAALGPVEIMVTSAGIEGFESFLDITPRGMGPHDGGQPDRDLPLHCQAAVPDMIEAGWGRIVTISSSSAQSGTRRMAHYVASKGGVIAFTKALALDLAPQRHHGQHHPARRHRHPHDAAADLSGTMNVDAVIARAPLGRLGTPEDIAATCVFLCSEEAGYITGQQINVNGGWYV